MKKHKVTNWYVYCIAMSGFMVSISHSYEIDMTCPPDLFAPCVDTAATSYRYPNTLNVYSAFHRDDVHMGLDALNIIKSTFVEKSRIALFE